MKKLFILFLTVCFLLVVGEGYSQESRKQAGFRFGNTTGFTAKFIKDDYFAFEGILGFRSGGAQIYGLFEARRPVFYNRLENMYLYFGGGLHAGFVKWNNYSDDQSPFYHPDYYGGNYYSHIGPAFGIDGVIGLEYAFNTIPISIAADFKPFFELYGPFYFRANFWDFGFHVRYNF